MVFFPLSHSDTHRPSFPYFLLILPFFPTVSPFFLTSQALYLEGPRSLSSSSSSGMPLSPTLTKHMQQLFFSKLFSILFYLMLQLNLKSHRKNQWGIQNKTEDIIKKTKKWKRVKVDILRVYQYSHLILLKWTATNSIPSINHIWSHVPIKMKYIT